MTQKKRKKERKKIYIHFTDKLKEKPPSLQNQYNIDKKKKERRNFGPTTAFYFGVLRYTFLYNIE